jgi:hypothetical protein
MKVKDIISTLGGDISTSNTKMPGTSFGLSATKCNVGCKLQPVKGSVCNGCYALKLEKLRPSVHKGYLNRTYQAKRLVEDEFRQRWQDAMVIRISQKAEKLNTKYHRWHDSGDLQSLEHFLAIVQVAIRLPGIQFWLPTKEKALVKQGVRMFFIPDNLVIRLSSSMVDGKPVNWGGLTCTVHKDRDPIGHACPALSQGNSCGDCRACWNPDVENVSYPKH